MKVHKPVAYIGIDPGAKGNFCCLIPELNKGDHFQTNGKPKGIHDWLCTQALTYSLRVIMIEDVHSLFGMSAKSNFSFGYNVGVVSALAGTIGITVDKVTPKKWQKFIGVKVKTKGKDIKKEVAEITERIYPQVNIRGPRGGLLDGLSDSLCIAHYAYLTYNQII